jgi:hypothetical protein
VVKYSVWLRLAIEGNLYLYVYEWEVFAHPLGLANPPLTAIPSKGL